MKPPRRDDLAAAQVGRVLGIVFGIVIGGVGITVLAFLWGTPRGEFGAPPLFFRIFGSFIALAFVAMGGSICLAALKGASPFGPAIRKLGITDRRAVPGESAGAPVSAGYVCPQCGASLGPKADVSPLGDVKCTFCGSWFNIHRASA